MSRVVAQGREVSINGRRYLGGEALPALDPGVIAQLEKDGAIEKLPKKDERK